MTKTTTRPDPRYRWAYPSDWLNDKIEEHAQGDRDVYMRLAEMTSLVNTLVSKLAEDDIQDLFQSEMDADGFFHNLNVCPDCETPLDATTEQGGNPSYCSTCDREVDHAG